MFKRFLSLLMAFALIMSLTSCWWKAKKVASVDTEKAAESDIEAENISTGTVESESETETETETETGTRGIPNAERETAISEISNTESEVPQIENKTVKSETNIVKNDSDISGGGGGTIGSEEVQSILKAAKKKVSFEDSEVGTNKKKKVVVNDGSLGSLINNARPAPIYPLRETTIEDIDTIKFGSYPQSDESGNTKDPIEWIVLERQHGKALLLSKYILDTKQYNAVEENVATTWKDCTLRNWLNTTFLNDAFSSSEQKSIRITNVENSDNKSHNTLGGGNTEDKIFLLSSEEAYKYFTEPNRRGVSYVIMRTKGTNYAKNVVIDEKKLRVGHEGDSFWLLRSVGEKQDRSKHVNADGVISPGGLPANNKFRGVRPAIWVMAESIEPYIYEEDSLTLIQDGVYELNGVDTKEKASPIQPTAAQQKEIDKVIAEFKSKYIKGKMTDFEKEMIIIQYLVAKVEYDLKNYAKVLRAQRDLSTKDKAEIEAFSAYGALVKGKACCAGYAAAFDALCKACGLESEYVVGPIDPAGLNGHAWNKIKLDGEWYWVDVTWEDPIPYGWGMYDPPIWEQNIYHNRFGWEDLSNLWINRTSDDFLYHYNTQYRTGGIAKQVQYEITNANGEREHKVDYMYYLDDSCSATKYGPEAVAEYLKTGKVKTK